jgi:gliding motility-associated lipoprotein GldH
MKLKNSIFFILIAVFFFFVKKRVFDEYKSVGVWNKDSIVTFDLPELDSTKRYDLFINLRDNNNYQYNNLWLCLLKSPTAIQK